MIKQLFAAALAVAAIGAQASTVTAIFGTDVTDQNWTSGTGANGVELALRARLRLPSPTNIVNTDGNGNYYYNPGAYSLYGFNNLAEWNFDFSINSGSSSIAQSGLTFSLSIDTNPGAGTTFATVNPFSVFVDNSFGNGSTTTGNGEDATDAASTADLMGRYNIAQNSENLGWLFSTFDPTQSGIYTVRLTANSATGGPVASTTINVIVGTVPEPGSLALVGLAMAGMGVVVRRRKA